MNAFRLLKYSGPIPIITIVTMTLMSALGLYDCFHVMDDKALGGNASTPLRILLIPLEIC